MANVTLKGIEKVYENGFQAVKGIDLEIKDKEFMILVGPSGCGKTTTLRMIAGLEEISSGELFIGEQMVNEVSPKDRNIAMVFQNYALYPHMTVYDNMAFGLKILKTPKAEIQSRIEKAAQILDIGPLLKRKPKQLSGGQRQRVALGRAIVRKPGVFLMDEPLSNLDAKLRVQMRAELIKLHHELATTFIYVTHDQTEAMTMGSRICVMNDGIIQQVDEPKVIYNSPANIFVAGFIGAPQMNFLEGMMIGDSRVEFEGHQLELSEEMIGHVRRHKKENKPVVLGVRPEDIALSQEEKSIDGRVEVAELLGSDLNIYFKINEKSYIMKTEASYTPEMGDQLKLKFNRDKIHLFDPETEQSLRNR